MRIGVPKEIKSDEYRVGLRPVGVEVLTAAGHAVAIERGAGLGSGLSDEAYRAADPATLIFEGEERVQETVRAALA